MGVCAKPNGISFPIDSLPTPAAFFPLSSYSTQSWPLPDHSFFNTSEPTVGWSQDFTFGEVVNCPVRTNAHTRACLTTLCDPPPLLHHNNLIPGPQNLCLSRNGKAKWVRFE